MHLRAKLDAVFFHLYGVTDRDDVRYIYSTFPIVERQETATYGRYRSRDLCLAWMNALGAGEPLHWSLGDNAVFLHAVGFQLGEETSVVPTVEKIAEGRVDLATQAAPDGLEFLDAEVTMRVAGDHCLIMTHFAQIGRVKTMLRNLLTKADFGDEAIRFDLIPIAKPKFRKLLNDKIKSVGFSFGFSAAAADNVIARKRTATFTGQMREMLLGLFTNTNDHEASWREAENLQVRVTVSYNGRVKGQLGAERVAGLAKRVNEGDEDDYTINFQERVQVHSGSNKGPKGGGNPIVRQDRFP